MNRRDFTFGSLASLAASTTPDAFYSAVVSKGANTEPPVHLADWCSVPVVTSSTDTAVSNILNGQRPKGEPTTADDESLQCVFHLRNERAVIEAVVQAALSKVCIERFEKRLLCLGREKMQPLLSSLLRKFVRDRYGDNLLMAYVSPRWALVSTPAAKAEARSEKPAVEVRCLRQNTVETLSGEGYPPIDVRVDAKRLAPPSELYDPDPVARLIERERGTPGTSQFSFERVIGRGRREQQSHDADVPSFRRCYIPDSTGHTRGWLRNYYVMFALLPKVRIPNPTIESIRVPVDPESGLPNTLVYARQTFHGLCEQTPGIGRGLHAFLERPADER